jgi:endo-1,4-beta-xylanase
MRRLAMHPVTRLCTGVTVLLATIGGASALWSGSGEPPAGRSFERPAAEGISGGLRQLAEPWHLGLGTAVQPAPFESNALYRTVLTQEFSSVTAESQLKWDLLQPTEGKFDWAGADALVEFAEQNTMAVRGHTLVWHTALPAWLERGAYTPQQLRDLLRGYIHDTVGRYRGRIGVWDVVNEPLADTSGQLRKSLWLNALGPGYVADALRWAHEADPQAKLYINDFGVENLNRKSDALYAMVAQLRADGVPIHGVGFQTHVTVNTPPTTLRENLRRFADLGVDVAITELDVRTPAAATDASSSAQAVVYANVLRDCLAVPRCVSVTVWGFTDQYSWIPYTYPGWGNACLFDATFRPKTAYGLIRQVLTEAPGR